jgi:ubiquinone/menaquinone biosynthesis C-methylase UbiE
MSTPNTSQNIQNSYDEQYSSQITGWREMGGKYKAQNILNVIQGNSFEKVLEFGAGEGSILSFLSKVDQFKELYALEISDSGIDLIKKRNIVKLKEVKKFDGYRTNYADEEFDLVYCSHVLEHVEHPRLVLREIKRISKQQVFEIPLDYNKSVDSQLEHFLGYGHINIFTPSLFKFLLKSEGFQIENELYSTLQKEVLEYGWYKNSHLKKTLKRIILASILPHKASIAKVFLGNKIAQEYYHSAYTCLVSKSADLKIF